MRKLFRSLVLLNIGLLAGLFVRDALAARNASGTMSAANGPYVAGTVISPTIINNRYADIEAEITDSLSRSGKGGMTAALRGIDGTVAAPALSFTSEPGTGLYRIGASDLGVAIGGVKKLELTGSLFTVTPASTFTGAVTLTGGVAGSLGVGLAPSFPLDVSGGTTVARLVGAGFSFGVVSRAALGPRLMSNATYNGVNDIYNGNGFAGMLELPAQGSDYVFYTAPSGAAAGAVTFTERLRVNTNGVTIGASGTAIGASYSGSSGAISLGAAGAAACNRYSGSPITVTGAVAGDQCIVGIDTASNAAWAALGYPTCQVTAANTAVVQICNPTAGALTPAASTTYSVRVFH